MYGKNHIHICHCSSSLLLIKETNLDAYWSGGQEEWLQLQNLILFRTLPIFCRSSYSVNISIIPT